jgi:predicted nucleic acid-binding protein
MPKVVSDTTPLISLLKLNRLELLQNIIHRSTFLPPYIKRVKQGEQKNITKIYLKLIG